MSYNEEYAAAKEAVEQRLSEFFTRGGLEEAMRYSLMAGGKRIRPVLTIKFCEAAGGSLEEALDMGCAVEMLHTYSLIHDDLPCMDNDDLRRGMPTNHKVFGECTATLAGDALQASAFRTALEASSRFEPGRMGNAVEAVRYFADAAGERGMCGGQYDDTKGDGTLHTAEELYGIDGKKTGALLRAACVMGVLTAAGYRGVSADCVPAAEEYAANLGLAFQIQDDILDAVSTTEELGKPVGSDEANLKSTYVTVLGVEKCGELVREYTERAKSALKNAEWAGGTEFLLELADSLAKRKS